MTGTTASATVGAGPRNAMASTSATDDSDRRRTGNATVLISLTVVKTARTNNRSTGCHCAAVVSVAATAIQTTSRAAFTSTSVGGPITPPSRLPGWPASPVAVGFDHRDGLVAGRSKPTT